MVFANIRFYAILAAAFVLGILGLRAFWIDGGIAREQQKRVEDRLKAMKAAKEVRDAVEILDDTGLADRASKWLRESK